MSIIGSGPRYLDYGAPGTRWAVDVLAAEGISASEQPLAALRELRRANRALSPTGVMHFTFLYDGAAQRTAECPTLEEASRSIEVGQVDRTLWSIQYMDREGGTRATVSPRTSATVTKDERAEPSTTTPDRGVTRICAWRPFGRCGSRLVSSGNGSSSTVGRPSREGESRPVGLCQVTTL